MPATRTPTRRVPSVRAPSVRAPSVRAAASNKPQQSEVGGMMGDMFGIFDGAGDDPGYYKQYRPRNIVGQEHLPGHKWDASSGQYRYYTDQDPFVTPREQGDDRNGGTFPADRYRPQTYTVGGGFSYQESVHPHGHRADEAKSFVPQSSPEYDFRTRRRKTLPNDAENAPKSVYDFTRRRKQDVQQTRPESARPKPQEQPHQATARPRQLPEQSKQPGSGFAFVEDCSQQLQELIERFSSEAAKYAALNEDAKRYQDRKDIYRTILKASHRKHNEMSDIFRSLAGLYRIVKEAMDDMDRPTWRRASDLLYEQNLYPPPTFEIQPPPPLDAEGDRDAPPSLTKGKPGNDRDDASWISQGEATTGHKPQNQRRNSAWGGVAAWGNEVKSPKSKNPVDAWGSEDIKSKKSENGWNKGGEKKSNDGWGGDSKSNQGGGGWDDHNKAQSNKSAGGWDNNSNAKSNKPASGWGGDDNKSKSNKSASGWGDDNKGQGNDAGGGWGNDDNDKPAADSWGNGDAKKPASAWGDEPKTQSRGHDRRPSNNNNSWGGDADKSKSRSRRPSRSHFSGPANDGAGSDTHSFGEQPKPVIKPYWGDWTKQQAMNAPKIQPREVYEYPALPLPVLPSGNKNEKGVTQAVHAGRGANYAHKLHRPEYLDSMAKPYAIFTFKYRSKAALAQILNHRIDDDHISEAKEEAKKHRLMSMPKDELVEELMKKASIAAARSKASTRAASNKDDDWGNAEKKSSTPRKPSSDWGSPPKARSNKGWDSPAPNRPPSKKRSPSKAPSNRGWNSKGDVRPADSVSQAGTNRGWSGSVKSNKPAGDGWGSERGKSAGGGGGGGWDGGSNKAANSGWATPKKSDEKKSKSGGGSGGWGGSAATAEHWNDDSLPKTKKNDKW